MNKFQAFSGRRPVLLVLSAGIGLGGSVVWLLNERAGEPDPAPRNREAFQTYRASERTGESSGPLPSSLAGAPSRSQAGASAAGSIAVQPQIRDAGAARPLPSPSQYHSTSPLFPSASGFRRNPVPPAPSTSTDSSAPSVPAFRQSLLKTSPVSNQTLQVTGTSGGFTETSGASPSGSGAPDGGGGLPAGVAPVIASTSTASQGAAIVFDPSAAGNLMTSGEQQVAVESIQQTPDGPNLDLAISPVEGTSTNSEQNRRGLTREQELFRMKWGWENYDLARRAAREVSQSP